MNKKLYILYSGGHAKQCIDIFLENDYQILGCFDDYFLKSKKEEEFYRGINIIGSIDDYLKLYNENLIHKNHFVFCCAGDNTIRKTIIDKYKDDNYINCISKHSYISDTSNIGIGNYIGVHSKIISNSLIGDFNIVNDGATIMNDCKINDFNHLAPNSSLGGRVKICSYCLIGTNCTVNPNVKICDKVTVGSGGVVLQNIIKEGVYVGVPVKQK